MSIVVKLEQLKLNIGSWIVFDMQTKNVYAYTNKHITIRIDKNDQLLGFSLDREVKMTGFNALSKQKQETKLNSSEMHQIVVSQWESQNES